VGVPHFDGHDARLLRRIVISSREEGVADEKHIAYGEAKDLFEFLHAIGLVNARLGDVDRGRAAQSKMRGSMVRETP